MRKKLTLHRQTLHRLDGLDGIVGGAPTTVPTHCYTCAVSCPATCLPTACIPAACSYQLGCGLTVSCQIC